MAQQRCGSTGASKGDDARNTEKSAQDHSLKDTHASDHSHSHSIFHSHSHDDHDHSHGAEQIVHIFEGKGELFFTGCYVLAQHLLCR